MNKNPFTLMYGTSSSSLIIRDDLNIVIDTFLNNSNMYMYLITGIRGSGKTVLLREITKTFSKNEQWECIDINSQGDITTSLANKLSVALNSNDLLDGWSISLNLKVLTITKANNNKISDPEIIIEKILEKYQKSGKKILVTIDEVNNTLEFKKFVNFYQSLIGKQLPIYLLMTGLKENINSIINDKAMTFLTRSPKINLGPLNESLIALEYEKIFEIEKNKAIKMAKLTAGYAFAYQVLGYLFFESEDKELNSKFIKEYENYLWGNGYSKFWNDLTNVEKKFLIALSKSKDGSKQEIISNDFNSENFSQYRMRLIEKGIIKQTKYGFLDFVLPLFKEYISYAKEFE